MDKLTYLIYTHIEYDDILDIHLKRLQKYFPTAPLSICTNNKDYIINKYSKTFGFKGDRNTAITIVGNFMRDQNIDINPQSFSDNKLYNILTTSSIDSAVNVVNTPEEEYTNKPAYVETWSL